MTTLRKPTVQQVIDALKAYPPDDVFFLCDPNTGERIEHFLMEHDPVFHEAMLMVASSETFPAEREAKQ